MIQDYVAKWEAKKKRRYCGSI